MSFTLHAVLLMTPPSASRTPPHAGAWGGRRASGKSEVATHLDRPYIGRDAGHQLPVASMSQDEGDSLGGRLGRYARVGSSVGGLAVKLAGQRYLGWNLDRDKHATELKAALGGLKGPLMKAAQLIATIPDALPPEYARELAQLQANAPAMGWAFVRRRMATELGPDWQAKFAKFDKEASFAASLGQVHRATLLDGTPAACKL